MNLHGWLQSAWHQAQRVGRQPEWAAGAEAGWGWDGWTETGRPWSGLWRGLTGRSLEMAEVQEEVAAESRGQVLIVGRDDALNRRLLAHLRDAPPVPAGGPVYREGFFTLVTLAEERAGRDDDALAAGWDLEDWLDLAQSSDLLLYLFDGRVGWQAADAHWCARLRATAAPLLLVAAGAAMSQASSGGEHETQEAPRTEDGPPPGRFPPWAGEVVTVSLAARDGAAGETPADVLRLVERMVARRPRLAIPLAQEIPGCRPWAAQRAIRAGMVMTGLLGAEPIPLLDLPLQVSLNWKVALEVAAIFGHTGLDHRSRELLATVAWNLVLRYLIQQAVKVVPLLGWGVSAGLSALGTWAFGNALLRYYRHEAQNEGHKADADRRPGRMGEAWARIKTGSPGRALLRRVADTLGAVIKALTPRRRRPAIRPPDAPE